MTETEHVPVSEQPLVAPSASSGLLGVFSRRYLLRLLVRREISARYQGSFLGLLWSYINPLSQFNIGNHRNFQDTGCLQLRKI